ncbi:unnamed protein product [Caenorhabditis angaria]|uniref:F-box domain-containing protein n=1 Tax=Caenorhabditis angaria TaxID=860376 RepID=A0A9P1N1H4_9PELO|nr:unnamed protein product [Caenorhabditis angaria]
MLIIFLILRKYLNFFTKPFAREIEEEKEEPPIKKLPFEVLGAIFEKLEYDDVQNLKNSSKFLFDAHQLERRMIAGPKYDANVYYNKNKELRLEITIFVDVPWIRILPFKRTIELTRNIPFDQWNYYFKNANCKELRMIVEEDEIPLGILKKIICCKSIEKLIYTGKSINQMSIDLLAAYNPQSFEIVLNRWSFKISQLINVSETWVLIKWQNIDDIFEAIKLTYDTIISLHPEIYEKNEDSLMKLKPNIKYHPHFCFHFANNKNTNEDKVQSLAYFLENNVSNVYGCYVECKVVEDGTGLHFICSGIPIADRAEPLIQQEEEQSAAVRFGGFVVLCILQAIAECFIKALFKLFVNFVKTML